MFYNNSYNNEENYLNDGLVDANTLNKNLPPYAEFNGREFSIYQNGQKIKSLPAMSGDPDYQCRTYTNLSDKGPIPEGKWNIDYSSYQFYPPDTQYDSLDEFFNKLSHQRWRNRPESWGNARIRIQPEDETNTFGRHSMYVRGGLVPGSAGCIDLTNHMPDFQEFVDEYQDDIPLYVNYDQECW